MFAIVVAALTAVSASLFSFPSTMMEGDCPDISLKRVEMRVEYGVNLPCAGISGSVGPVTLSSASACPAFIVVEPLHMEPVHVAGCGTYVEPSGSWQIRQFNFQCQRAYVLIIPWGTSCVIVSDRVIAEHSNYALKACRSGPEANQ